MGTELAERNTDSGVNTEALSRLPRDVVAMRVEREQMMSLALAHPRNHEAVLASLRDQLRAYRSFRESAIYAVDVGKDPKTGKRKIARGLSIRAAEAIRDALKYTSITADVNATDNPYEYKVAVTFTDFQNCNTTTVARIASRKYTMSRERGGGEGVLDIGTFMRATVPAMISKAMREAVLRTIPAGLKSELELMVGEAMAEVLSPAQVAKLIGKFAERSVTQQQLEEFLGTKAENWSRDDMADLHALWVGIEDGEQSIAELFGPKAGADTPKRGTEALQQAVTPKGAAQVTPREPGQEG